LVSPALQRGEKGFHRFVTESRRDGARTLFMQEPIAPGKNANVRGLQARASAPFLPQETYTPEQLSNPIFLRGVARGR
jgi:hypothetical protein